MNLLYLIPRVREGLIRTQSSAFRRLVRAQIGDGLRLYGWPIVSFAQGSRVVLGRNLNLVSVSEFSEIGVNHPCILRTLTARATLVVGDNVGMSGCTVCAAERVAIGNECLLGANVLIADTDFHPLELQDRRWRRDNVETAPVDIGDNVFVGVGAQILKGVTIGENSVIGAGSVVTRDVPANVIAAGVPARVIDSVT